MPHEPTLLAVPNVSEGRDHGAIEAVAEAFAPARLLDVHSDADHHRSVLTLASRQGELAAALASGAREATARIDLTRHDGIHPRVGALDVAPVVHLDAAARGAATAEALTAAALIGEDVGLPVFLYGALATDPGNTERADLRRGGPPELARRMRAGELVPDFGPAEPHPTAGAVLVTARPPLIAFNLDLETAEVEVARSIAARIRESGGGFTGLRAIGLHLAGRGRAQVSMNVHDHTVAPLAHIVAAVRQEAEVAEAELVGLAPAAALEGFPGDVPIRGFAPERHVIENALAATASD